MQNNNLINIIKDLWEKDQGIRTNKGISLNELRKHDIKQTQLVKEIYEDYGLITSRDFPSKIVNTFVFLVQHALDVEFAEKYLKDLLENGEKEDKKKTPYLIDKILVAQNKNQIYGTIVSTTRSADGTLITKPKPYDDPDNLELRRKSVGLISMKEYLKQAEELYKNISRK